MPEAGVSPALGDLLARLRAQVDAALERWLPPQTERPPRVHDAMRYSVFAGGKRLRPILALLAAEAAGGKAEDALPAGAALEMIHTYSLIHDDLPAMDDDDLRRGRPTCHKVYGEAIAILAGDALLTRAFEVLAGAEASGAPAARRLQIVAEIAEAAGSRGMVGGQAMDIAAEGQQIGLDTLQYLHAQKTAALIRAAIRAGAIAGGATAEVLERLTRYGNCLGLAFQIVDDILDVEGDSAEMGKTAGSDQRKRKATYPAIVGMEASRREVARLLQDAREALAPLGERARPLLDLADFVGNRRR
ncbi:MAG: polyprenyl synthetase family protein [Candidatus Methylomirabilales bacterium]